MAGCPVTLPDDVTTTSLEIELRIEGSHPKNLTGRDACLIGDVIENFFGQIPVDVLRPLQDRYDRALLILEFIEDFVQKSQIQSFLRGHTYPP